MRLSALILCLLLLTAAASRAQRQIIPGADQMERYLPLLKGKAVAVFANPTSVVGNTHLVDTLLRRGITIRKIFSPEHGFRGDADAGATIASQKDPATGLPVVSLYGAKTKPTPADLKDVDLLLFDIQDVGVRFYTYISSLQKYMEAAIENHKPLVILDRPNPNGFYVDGPVLGTQFRSFVGMQPIPIVYGMTIGEYARMLLGEHWIAGDAAQLTIIPCLHYTHQSRYILPVKPSPNLPDIQSIYLYPDLCLFEGTPISVGRGTAKPFQQWGHPSLPDNGYHFTPESTPGALHPPLQGLICNGYDLSGIDTRKEPGGRWTLKWILQAWAAYPDKEHFFTGNGSTFDRLAGSDVLRQQIQKGMTEEQIRASWEPALSNFKKIRKKYLLYAD